MKGKTHDIYLITKTTVYTGDRVDILRHKDARNSCIFDLPAPTCTWPIQNKNGYKNTNCVPSSMWQNLWLRTIYILFNFNKVQTVIIFCTNVNFNCIVHIYKILLYLSITGGSNYLVRMFKIIFWNVRIHVFPNVGGQKHLVRDTKVQRGSK